MLTVEIRRFILTSIPSVPYLEALLLLRLEPNILWTKASVAKRLYISEKNANDLLQQLQGGHVITPDDDQQGFIYSPCADELRYLIDQLAELYSKDLLEITHLIHSTPDRKAQQFADAFKMRKDS